jgi:hypothetical protein
VPSLVFDFDSFIPTIFKPQPIYMRLPRMDAAQLTLVRTAFNDPDLLFELKTRRLPRTRLYPYINDGHCELVSRRRNPYKSFRELRNHLAGLKVKNAVIDGELVCLDSKGRSIFNELLLRKGCPIFYAFDLLYLIDRDLRPQGSPKTGHRGSPQNRPQ